MPASRGGVKREILLTKTDGKQIRITVPDGAQLTFGPWSPPGKRGEFQDGRAVGTLRIYQGSKDNIIGCFSGIVSFRDMGLEYAEEVAREEGATIWKSDEKGYMREDKVKRTKDWVAALPPKKHT